MGDGPTREEFTAFCNRVYQQMDDGFTGVHDRLDTLNGRTGKGEVERAELKQRITSVEKEVFAVPRRRSGDTEQAEQRAWLSKRDSAILALGLGVLATLLKIALVVGDVALEAFKHAMKLK